MKVIESIYKDALFEAYNRMKDRIILGETVTFKEFMECVGEIYRVKLRQLKREIETLGVDDE